MEEIIKCPNKCCSIIRKPYIREDNKDIYTKNRKYKAGCCIYDPQTSRILVIQSLGKFYGLPKGSIEEGESFIDAAIRETEEETGLKILQSQMKSYVTIKRTRYFFVEMKEKNTFPLHLNGDVNACGWVKLNCLYDIVNTNYIHVNRELKLLLNR